jgi:hypothetical protein
MCIKSQVSAIMYTVQCLHCIFIHMALDCDLTVYYTLPDFFKKDHTYCWDLPNNFFLRTTTTSNKCKF